MASTSKKQRIAIWGILILTLVSTIALYAGVILSQQNSSTEARTQQKAMEEYQNKANEYKEKLAKQADELSSKYYDDFKEYEKSPAAFNTANVKELKKKDLKVGDGEEVTDETTEFTAYYIGWKPDGVVFDGSFKDGKLTNPIAVKKTGDNWGVITGWSEGVQGMKIGGIRELTLPADKAYGATGSPSADDKDKNIDPNTPLKFIVMLVPKAEEIPEPDFSNLGL